MFRLINGGEIRDHVASAETALEQMGYELEAVMSYEPTSTGELVPVCPDCEETCEPEDGACHTVECPSYHCNFECPQGDEDFHLVREPGAEEFGPGVRVFESHEDAQAWAEYRGWASPVERYQPRPEPELQGMAKLVGSTSQGRDVAAPER